jgi:hypothetical protein
LRQSALTPEDVHLIRTSGLPDSHWEQLLGITRTCVQKARVGVTWTTHPTPPDKARRATSNRKGGRPQVDRLPQMSIAEIETSRLLARWPAPNADALNCSTLGTGPLEPESIP